MAISNFVFFYALNATKLLLLARRRGGGRGADIGRLRSLLASILAGVVNVLITNPLWVANLRIVQGGSGGRSGSCDPTTTDGDDDSGAHLSSSSPSWRKNDDRRRRARAAVATATPGLLSTVGTIARTEGVSGLWSGTLASLLLVSNPALQFFLYEQIKQTILSRRRRRAPGRGGGSSAAVLLSPTGAERIVCLICS